MSKRTPPRDELPELMRALDTFLQKYFRSAPGRDAELDRLVAAGRSATPELLEQSTHALGHPSPEVVVKACVVLGAGRFNEAVPVLLHRLGEGNLLTMSAIIWALGEIGDLRAVRPLEGLWARGMHREAIAEAFVKLGELDPVSYLALGLEDGDTRVRLYAAGALAALFERHAGTGALDEYAGVAPRLERALSDVFSPVRVLAAAALASLGRSFSRQEIKLLLEAGLEAQALSPLESFFMQRS